MGINACNNVKTHPISPEIPHLLRWIFSNYPDSSSKILLVAGAFWQSVISIINRTQVYRKQCIWWIMSAKRESTRIKRLNILIDCSEKELAIPQLRRS